MTTHHGSPRAWRLILARLHHDRHAEELIRNECGDCPECLADLIDHTAAIATTLLITKTGADIDAATRIAESEIMLDLQAAERDAQGLPLTAEWIARCLDRPWLRRITKNVPPNPRRKTA